VPESRVPVISVLVMLGRKLGVRLTGRGGNRKGEWSAQRGVTL
jgi:hypothetical protein